MKSTLVFSAASLLSAISASPLPFGTPDQPEYYYPATTNVYNVKDGSVDFDSAYGIVSRARDNSTPELSTLVNVYFYDNSAGKTCRFNFELDSEGYTLQTNNGVYPEIDVFVSGANINGDIPGV